MVTSDDRPLLTFSAVLLDQLSLLLVWIFSFIAKFYAGGHGHCTGWLRVPCFGLCLLLDMTGELPAQRGTHHCDLLFRQFSHGSAVVIDVLACSGHQSFSNSRKLNDFVGNITHSSILVPYHGWRVSHRTHHQHHGHVENDESWHPVSKKLYDSMVSHSMAAPSTLLVHACVALHSDLLVSITTCICCSANATQLLTQVSCFLDLLGGLLYTSV